MTEIEKLKLAQQQTKFKINPNQKMYYYGTEKETESFRDELKKCVRENNG